MAMQKAGRALGALASALVIGMPAASYAWNQTSFALATYWDPPLSCQSGTCGSDSTGDVTRFQLAKSAYFNLFTGTQDNAFDNAANPCPGSCPGSQPCVTAPLNIDQTTWGQKYALRIASRAGMMYMVRDYALWKHPTLTLDPADPIGTVANAYYMQLPVSTLAYLYGFNYWDEVPNIGGSTHNYIRKSIYRFHSATSTLAYASFFPYYECLGTEHPDENCQPNFPSRASYEAYVDRYLAAQLEAPYSEAPPKIVAFDNYPFTVYGTRRTYFYNLSVLRAKAGTKPLWAHVLSTGHGNTYHDGVFYPDPSASQLRFMSFCPIAYGAKGLIYFTYAKPTEIPCNTNYWSQPALIDGSGNPVQPKFDNVKAINRYIKYTLGPVVMQNLRVGTYHASSAPTGETVPTGENLSNSNLIVSTNNTNLVFGVFDAGGGGYKIVIVNKNTSTSASNLAVTVFGNRTGSLSVTSSHATGGQGVGYSTATRVHDYGSNTTQFQVGSLDAGGAVVLYVSDTVGGGCGDPPCQTEPAIAGERGLIVVPSPTSGLSWFRLARADDAFHSVRIYDLAGRTVALLRASEDGAVRELRWDGRDRSGAPVKAGMYTYSAQTRRGNHTGRLSVVR